MSAMDFASALQGGGPPPGPPSGPPQEQGPPDDTAQGGELFDNSLEALDVAEEALHAFIRLDPDEVDRAQAGQALQVVLKLKAANQRSEQAGDMKSLARALSGGGAIAQAAPASA